MIGHFGFDGRIVRVASEVGMAIRILAQPTNHRVHGSGGGQRILKSTSTPTARDVGRSPTEAV